MRRIYRIVYCAAHVSEVEILMDGLTALPARDSAYRRKSYL